MIYEQASNRVKLTNIDTISGSFPGSISITKDTSDPHASDFIVLSPMNYTVIPTGLSESASCGNDYNYGMNIFNQSENNDLTDIDANEFTDNISEIETNPDEITPIPPSLATAEARPDIEIPTPIPPWMMGTLIFNSPRFSDFMLMALMN